MEKRIVIASLLVSSVLVGTLAILAVAGNVPETVKLWPEGAPGAVGTTEADIPTLTIYRPPDGKANGAAVIVCPGGGYGGLAPHENKPIAEWLTSFGVTGIVLKYRLGPRYRHPTMLTDVSRAIRMTRAKAEEWKIDPKRIGIIGFSAGGHLASTAATHFDSGIAAATNPVDKISSRPDFAILLYPVITMESPFTHQGSRNNLLGENPSKELIALLSNEKQVSPETPPSFLMHTRADKVVPWENSYLYVQACHKVGVPVEFHLYDEGPHGVGLAGSDPLLSLWPKLCEKWMEKRGYLKK
jgi:acetyl esterase/lipase